MAQIPFHRERVCVCVCVVRIILQPHVIIPLFDSGFCYVTSTNFYTGVIDVSTPSLGLRIKMNTLNFFLN